MAGAKSNFFICLGREITSDRETVEKRRASQVGKSCETRICSRIVYRIVTRISAKGICVEMRITDCVANSNLSILLWHKLVDKFGAENIHLIFTDTDSLAFELTGQTYKEVDLIYHNIKDDPEYASLLDLRDVPDVHKEGTVENPYWSMKNESVMGKFNFEVIGI